jgi:hypothetical protein
MSLGGRRWGAGLAVVVLLLGLAVPVAGASHAPVTMFRQDQVHRLYLAAFGRSPDAAGLRHWVGSSLDIREIAVNLAESPEFLRRYGHLGDYQFVEQLHLDVVGEPGDPQELGQTAMWLGGSQPRHCKGPAANDPDACPQPHRGAVVLTYASWHVLIAVGGDPGAAIKMGSFDQIRRLYGGAFDRMPDLSEVEYWLWGMPEAERSYEYNLDEKNLKPVRSVAGSVVLAPEFLNRYGGLTNRDFVSRLYVTALHRQPEASGLAYWTALLDGGLPRWQVLLQIANSYELAHRLALATAG